MVLALLLSVTPLPYEWQWFWPRWPALVLLWWNMRQPQNPVGIWTWGFIGLLMDVLTFTSLGRQMIGYALIGWIDMNWRRSPAGYGRNHDWPNLVLRTLMIMSVLEGCLLTIDAITGPGVNIVGSLSTVVVSVPVILLLYRIIPVRDS